MASSRYQENFRHNVKVLLASRQMTVTELADKLGVSRQAISEALRTEQGITIERAERIATALEMPLPAMLSERFPAHN